MSGDIGVYVHIPFCTKKCPYCHFFVLPDTAPSLHDQLLQGLIAEWRLLNVREKLATVYFGGGTPSLFGPKRVEAVLRELGGEPVEVTLEVNPERVTIEGMREYLASGVNRISLGVQSFDDALLKKIGRTHDSSRALGALEAIVAAGFTNVTIDLMYDLPSQSVEVWEETLKLAVSLPITHISLYNLQIEPNTVFYKTKPKQPSQEESLAMYEMAMETLSTHGFYQYEISAFARRGFEAKHNSRYWRSEPFFGLGPSAFSDVEGERRQNVCHMGRYLRALEGGELPIDFREVLPYPQSVLERFVVNLRLLEGVSMDRWDLPEASWVRVRELADMGLVELSGDKVKLTRRGVLLFDSVATELI